MTIYNPPPVPHIKPPPAPPIAPRPGGKWMKKPPIVKGYYWCRHEDADSSFLTEVHAESGVFLWAWGIEKDLSIPEVYLHEHEWWSQRIKRPEE